MTQSSIRRRLFSLGLVAGLIQTGWVLDAPAQQQPYSQFPGYGYPYAFPGQQQPGYWPPGNQPRPHYSPQPSESTDRERRSDSSYAAPRQQPPQYRPQQPWPSNPTSPYGRQSGSESLPPPRLDVSVPLRTPYEHQPLILTLRVISSANLESVQPEIPTVGSLIITKLDGPVVGSLRTNGRQEIINTFHYAVTPLTSGSITIPSIRVTGNQSGGRREGFDLASPASILLEVRPMSAQVQPWLPLHGLVLQSYLEGIDRLEVGQPVTLVVNISAVGATGGQLPSFEQALNKSGFHVYRERSENEGKLSTDGRYLLGKKSETFTLVPQHGGKLQIPELRIDWWNVDTGLPETSVVPIRQIVARGDPGSQDGKIADLFPGASSVLLWVPLIGLFSVTIGFWMLAWLRKKRFMMVVEEEMGILAAFGASRFRAFLAWLSPIRRLQKVRQVFVKALPRSFRLWFCVRVVDGETDPEVWSYMLKFLANKHLSIPPQLPMQELGDRLVAIHHRADTEQMRSLMLELDETLYGKEPLDFFHWKKRFRNQLRPSWLTPLRWGGRSRRARPERLPRLNPDMS